MSSRRAQPSSTAGLTLTDAVCIIVGIVVGPGIFEASSSIARSLPSLESLIWIWIVGGVLSLAGVMCYAELASRYPHNAGEYVWLEAAYGRRIADLFLWSDVVIVRPGAIAAMAFPAAKYCKAIIPTITLTDTELATFIIVVFSLLNLAGFYVGKITQNALTILTIGAIITVIGAGLFAVPDAPYDHATVHNQSTLNYGLALILVLFTFGGWNEIANVTGDILSGPKGLYRASLVSLGITTCLYVGINYVFASQLGFAQYGALPLPVITGLERLFSKAAITVVYGIIFISCLGTIQGMIFTGARLYFYLPIWRNREPSGLSKCQLRLSYLIQGFIAALITIATTSFVDAVVYTTTVVWIFFLLKGLAVPLLRRSSKTLPAFQVPLYPIPTIVFCGSCFYLAVAAYTYSPKGSLVSLGVVALGLILRPAVERFSKSVDS